MSGKRILIYASPRKRGKPLWKLLAFLALAACVSVIYWLCRDWWAYVEDIRGSRWKTSEMPVWWQLFESALVGLWVTRFFMVGLRVRMFPRLFACRSRVIILIFLRKGFYAHRNWSISRSVTPRFGTVHTTRSRHFANREQHE